MHGTALLEWKSCTSKKKEEKNIKIPGCSSLPAHVQVQIAVMQHFNFLMRNLFLFVAEPEQRWHEV